MKNLLIILFILFSSLAGIAQNPIVDFEYYVDEDPGYNLATPIPITPGLLHELDFTVSTGGLSKGMHLVGMRGRDDRNNWSLDFIQFFYVDLLQSIGDPISRVEYFIDTDPGIGNATDVSITPGNVVELAFDVDVSSLESGFHFLSIRSASENNVWSHAYTSMFLMDVLDSGESPITKVEYFIDDDPGIGNATNVSITPGKVVDLAFDVDVSNLGSGFHFLSIRSASENNVWSHAYTGMFLMDVLDSGESPITKVEYFIDDDPGIGNATDVAITPGKIVDLAFDVDLSNLASGFHIVSVRSATENNTWSHAYTTMFLMDVLDAGESPIVQVEYFIDGDPGIGSATQVPITPGNVVDLSFEVELNDLEPGFHFVTVRSKSEADVWSMGYYQMFYIDHISSLNDPNLVEVEYFLDEDPGFGNGVPRNINPPLAVADKEMIVSFGSVEPGEHILYMRARDEFDNWSIVAYDTVMVEQGNYYALRFDGEDDYLEAGEVPFPEDDMTIEAWINPTELSGYQEIVFWYGDVAGVQFRLEPDGSLLYGESSNGWGYVTSEPGIIPTNKWTHIALTKEGDLCNLYANGIHVGFSQFDNNPVCHTLQIGGRGRNMDRFFNGDIDEVRIWNVALAQEEIMDNFCTYFEGGEEGLFGLWHCNEGPGSSVAYDFGPNGYGAWLNNMEVNAGPDCAWVDHSCELPPANDLAITSLATPEDLVLASASSAEEVTVYVRNFGIETWDGNVTLSYHLDDGGTISENTYFFLNPGDVVQFTFGAFVDLSVPGIYQLTAGLSAPGDEYLENNTLTRSITSVEIARSVYAYNGYSNLSGLPGGPVVFDLENPETVFSLADQSNEYYFNGGTWMDGQWWAIANDTLYTIDTITGNRTFIGVPGNAIAALAYDPLGEKLYGLSWTSLEEIDPVTGNSTYIGYSGTEGFAAMASDTDGNLYALNVQDDQIYQLDKETGLATAIGYIGFDANYEQDMDFDPITGNIYLAAYNVDVNQGELRTVDPLTGNTSYLGTFRGGMEITGFAIPYNPPQPPAEYALRFDGEDDYLEAGDVPFPEDDLTIEAWINPTELIGIHEIVFLLGDAASVQFRLDEGGSLLYGEAANGSWAYAVSRDGAVQTNQWTHVAITKAGDLCNLYVNGIHEAFSQFDNNPITHTLQIGGRGQNMDRFFKGDIDEVRIWNVARTQEEIMDNFCTEFTGNEGGIYGLWHFNDGSGSSVATDSGPNSFGAWFYNMDPNPGPACAWIVHSCLLPPAINLALTSISAPEELLLAKASAAVEVIVQVRNFGTETYNGDATIAYQLDGADIVSEITNLNLIPGDVLDFTFSTPADFSIPGVYELKTFITAIGDEHPENDSLSKEINSVAIGRSAYAYNTYPGGSGLPKGPIVFDLENPEHLFSLADQSNKSYLKGGTWMDGKWWAIANDTLYTIDTITGNRTLVGVPGSFISSLAYDPVGEKLFGLSWVSLEEIDPITGNSTYLGYTGFEGFTAMACNAEGNLYALNTEDDQIYQLNKENGEATVVGPIGFDANYDQDMDFDPNTGNIYLTALNDGAGQGELRTVDPLTGNTTYIGTFRGGMEVSGFAIPATITPPITNNNALHFDGDDDWVEVPDLLCPNQFTIECWVNYQGLVSFSYNTLVEFDNDNPWIGINQGKASIFQVVSSDEEIGEGWHHLAFVVGEDFSRIFVDGQEAGYAGWRPSISTLPGMGIGYHYGDSYWSGSVDELRIWDYARNETEVNATMNQELSGSESGLVAYYNFNQGVAGGDNTNITTLYNSATSKAYNGTLNSFLLTGNTSNFIQAGWQNNGLVADFYATPEFGKVPLEVAFTDISSGAIESWLWDFGDGNTSSTQHPDHTYTESGFYTVSLTVTNADDSDTETKEGYIEVEPLTIYDLQFSTIPGPDNTYPSHFADMTVTVSGLVYATNVNGAGNAFFITAPEGGPWNGIFVYNADIEPALGDEVVLTGLVTEYNGLTEINSPVGSILSSENSLPSAQIIATGDLLTPAVAEPFESCLVQVQNVIVTQIANQYGEWQVDDESGACAVDDRIYAYTPYLGESLGFVRGPVYYNFGYYVIDPRDEADIQNNVFAAEFTADVTSGFVPLSVDFTDFSTGSPDSWLWDFGDGETSTLQNPSHVYATFGIYTVSLTVSDGLAEDTETKEGYIEVYQTQNGDWSLQHICIENTPEAELMIRAGDIDNLGFGWPVGFDPFTGQSTPQHAFPWEPNPEDTGGTDRVMVVTSYSGGSTPCGTDGYTSTTSRPENLPEPIIIDLCQISLGEITSAALQIFVDDIQPISFCADYTVKLNGQTFAPLQTFINSIDQSGPIGRMLTVRVPDDMLYLLEGEQLELEIDDFTTGAGDGFAIDFVKLLINEGALVHSGSIDGNVYDSQTSQPIAGAEVEASFWETAITFADGSYNINEVPAGLVYIECRAPGYFTQHQLVNLSSGVNATVDFWLEDDFSADFSGDPLFGYVPLAVQFTDLSAGNPVSWAWQFGDGSTSNLQHPVHLYTVAGDYDVTLTVYDGSEYYQTTKQAYVHVENEPLGEWLAEYFFDFEPGYGMATPVYAGTKSSTIAFEANTASLNDGYHTLYVRTKDVAGAWSQTLARSFLVARLPQDIRAKVTQVEYFMDNDPGFGKGTIILVDPEVTVEIPININLWETGDGLHNVFIRGFDNYGNWGQAICRPFLVSTVNEDVEVRRMEYFIDADPGTGNGMPVAMEPSSTVSKTFLVDLSGQANGEHRLYVRAEDDRGGWSIIYNALFEVDPNSGAVHIIELAQGWSGISSFVIPDDPTIETIFEPVVDELVILQNFDGMYWPYAGVNTIGNWNDMNGYQVKMAMAQQVTFTGTMQDMLTANLEDGWNYLPVLNSCDNFSDELFSEISGSLQIVKEVAGPNVYWPQFGINTLEMIKPGKAYFVLVDEVVVVEFPECTNKSSTLTGASTLSGQESHKNLTESSDLSEFDLSATPITHTIAIPFEAISGLAEGDVIGVYGANGQCYGAVVSQSRNLALTAYGDDPTTTQIDGLTEGETMQFRVYNPETAKEYPLEVEFDEQMPQGGYFVNHGLSAVKSIQATGISSVTEMNASVKIYPNPSTGIFNVRASDLTGFENLLGLTIDWKISDIHGSIVATGNGKGEDFSINLSSHPKGIYHLKITQGGLHVVKKLVLQ